MYLFEHCVKHGLVVVEGDGADERPAELVYVAQGHGREVHFLEGRPAITFSDTQIQGDHSCCAKPPVDSKTKLRFSTWASYYMMSTGGLAQPEWSPCICVSSVKFIHQEM